MAVTLKSCKTKEIDAVVCLDSDWIELSMFGNSYAGLTPGEAERLGTWLVKAAKEMKLMKEKQRTKQQEKSSKSRGFTLIELLVAFVVLVGLAAVGVVVLNKVTSEYEATHPDVSQVEDARTPQEKTRDDCGVVKLFEVDGCSVYQYRSPDDIGARRKDLVVCKSDKVGTIVSDQK